MLHLDIGTVDVILWIILLLLLCALAALHLWWRKRYVAVRTNLLEQQQQNVSARRQYETALNQSLAQQQTVFNSMVEGVLVLDGQRRIQMANQSLKRLFDSPHPLEGKTVLEAFRNSELHQLVVRAWKEGEVFNYELQQAGTKTRDLEVNATAILDSEKNRHGLILVFHDLTRLKQLENVRKEFVANVSHELRTPLSLIKGYVETLLDGAGHDPEITARFLRTIQRQTDRLTFLIEDLLILSQLESGASALHIQPLEISALIERVLSDLERPAAEKNTRLENHSPAGLFVPADADRLHQVLWNLVDNAIKYGRKDGFVRIEAKPNEEQRSIVVSVEDNGPGIPAEARERIFERFYRVDRARSREQGGTGLGLSIVKHIIQTHGGNVWVESELGKGSTFFLALLMQNASQEE